MMIAPTRNHSPLFRRTLAENVGRARRTPFETQRTLGETDAQLSALDARWLRISCGRQRGNPVFDGASYGDGYSVRFLIADQS